MWKERAESSTCTLKERRSKKKLVRPSYLTLSVSFKVISDLSLCKSSVVAGDSASVGEGRHC